MRYKKLYYYYQFNIALKQICFSCGFLHSVNCCCLLRCEPGLSGAKLLAFEVMILNCFRLKIAAHIKILLKSPNAFSMHPFNFSPSISFPSQLS